MSASTRNAPQQGNPREPKSLWGLIATLFAASPSWLRAVVMVLIALSIAYAIVVYHTKDGGAEPAEQYPASRGSKANPQGNHNQDPGNLEAQRRIDEDNEHLKWHTIHEKADPGWKPVEETDENNYVRHKYYQTDKCMYIVRMVNGFSTPQWNRFPTFQNAQPATGSLSPSKVSGLSGRQNTFGGALFPTVEAAPPPHPVDRPESQQVQSGCLNPHPWPFQWWWGKPADQCWSPLYRKWKDGCLHYQWYNRCANAWDPVINWVTCVGDHHE